MFKFVLVTTLLSSSVSYQSHYKVMCLCAELHFGLTERKTGVGSLFGLAQQRETGV